MKPILKWPGGKHKLAEQIINIFPKEYNTYYEPFIGGAAIFLSLEPERAVINDINSELINVYCSVSENPDTVFYWLDRLDSDHELAADKKKYYLTIRKMFNDNLDSDSPAQAARFIYLNKHCFNGIYRVNKKGYFNVPYNGKSSGASCTKEHILEASKVFSKTEIKNTDFVTAVRNADKGDLVYLDPPYDNLTPTSFTSYTTSGFTKDDQKRVAEVFKELSDRGCCCVASNHDTSLVRGLYKDYNIIEVNVTRSINCKGDNRKGKEVIISNY